MRAHHGISRRHVLGMAVAIGSLAITGRSRRVWGQATPRIEQLAPELEKVITPSAPVQEVAAAFGGALGPAEGPVWWTEGSYVV